MTPRTWLAIACLLIGVPLAAWALADGRLLLALVGFALIFTFLFFVLDGMAKAGKPKHEIKHAANAAWNMKNEPPADSGTGRQ
jgi:membrane protein implicated in regulation of membrane protease activity